MKMIHTIQVQVHPQSYKRREHPPRIRIGIKWVKEKRITTTKNSMCYVIRKVFIIFVGLIATKTKTAMTATASFASIHPLCVCVCSRASAAGVWRRFILRMMPFTCSIVTGVLYANCCCLFCFIIIFSVLVKNKISFFLSLTLSLHLLRCCVSLRHSAIAVAMHVAAALIRLPFIRAILSVLLLGENRNVQLFE